VQNPTEPSLWYVVSLFSTYTTLILIEEDTFGSLVIQNIIPAISRMQTHLQLSLDMVLSKELLESNNIPYQVNIGDLDDCQHFLSFIKTE